VDRDDTPFTQEKLTLQVMHLSKFQLFNYKSFVNSGLLEFQPGINIIVGQNNSGKTALLETLTLNFSDSPHRSIKTLPTPQSIITKKSRAKITLSFKKDELKTLIEQLPPDSNFLQIPYQKELPLSSWVNIFQEWLDNEEPAEITISLFNEPLWLSIKFEIEDLLLPVDPDSQIRCKIRGTKPYLPLDKSFKKYSIAKARNGRFTLSESTLLNEEDNLLITLFSHFQNHMYRFNAERFNLGSCLFGHNSNLKPDASNLAEVLNLLQLRGTKRVFERLNQYVSIIFPTIKEVAVKPNKLNSITHESELEIRIWSQEAAENDREDLSFPLSACGTGISQVLAILYVVITAPAAQTIIIDEPQSFLHPGAAKKLMDILKEFPQHQYFIATHSPQIISAATPSTIVQLRYEDSETKASVIDSSISTQLRSLLAEVGISLSDVFGADNILWVEGPTEERCFPLILKNVAQQPLRGTQILALKNTGDLEGKRAHIIFDIYDKLSGGNSLFPPAIGFIFDREKRSEQEIKDLQKRSQNPVKFLPRRMYENYLLYPEAIATVINGERKYSEQPLTSTEIQEWLDRTKLQGSFLPKHIQKAGLSDSEWSCNVDGANLLKSLFSELSETRVEFSKNKHSFLITKWLVENNPDCLSDVAEFLQDVLNRKLMVES